MRAIEENDDDDEICKLLDSGVDVNAQDKCGVTALMLAAQQDVEYVYLLLDNGADVNAQDEYGVTALMIAVQQDINESVLLLLDKGADVNMRDKSGSTALMFIEGNFIARLLLGKGAMINTQAYDGRTSLFCAVENGNSQCVAFLLAKGADPSIANEVGQTPFAAAAGLSEAGFEELMEDILEDLAKYHNRKGSAGVEVDNDAHAAAKKGSAVSKNKCRAKSRAGNCEAAPKPQSAPDSEDPRFQHLRQSSLQLANSFFCFIVFSCKFLKECRELYH